MLQYLLKHRINPSAIYSQENRKRFLAAGALSVVSIALLDAVTPGIPLGFLYFFPVLLIAGFVSRKTLVIVSLVCGILTGKYSDYRLAEALSVSLTAFAGFTGTGFLVSEILRSRQLVVEHEKELRGLVETSPLAIVTIGPNGRIRLANEAAQKLFAPGGPRFLVNPLPNSSRPCNPWCNNIDLRYSGPNSAAMASARMEKHSSQECGSRLPGRLIILCWRQSSSTFRRTYGIAKIKVLSIF